jgi:pre-mRNA-processing factor 19
VESLIPVAGADPAIPPRLPTATSLPSMLSLFQQEWDAVLLQLHLQSKKLHETGMELAVSLYENDAAKRVISRLVKERDDARRELEESAGGVPVTKKRAAEPVEKSVKKTKVADDAMEIDSLLDASIVEILDTTAKM